MSRKRYPLRVARTAHGIRAQDLRTLVRNAWWARRWIGALEAMRLGPRMGRGRQYAISGQVISLEMEGPHVEARVMGSRPEPYRVSLDFTATTLDGPTAETIIKEPMLLSRLLTDDLPIEIEELLRQEGVALFPKVEPIGKTVEGKSIYDVKMNCNCPDWMRPCKHLIAVLLLLGEEIAHHPATLLALRGIDIDDFFPAKDGIDAVSQKGRAVVADELGGPRDPLATDIGALAVSSEPAPLIKRLGPIPYWRGSQRCQEALARIYARVRPLAQEAMESHSVDLRI